jgi:YVTN family beta-propeller protein
LAYDTARGEVFVANHASDNVSVINDTMNTVVATVPVPNGPSALAYDSATGEVFVTADNPDNVSVINDSTNAEVTTLAVGGTPNGVAYDSGKREVFVAIDGPNTVSVISDMTDAVVASIEVGFEPTDVAYDSGKGEIFVTNSNSNSVSVISDTTNTVVANIPVRSYPEGAAYDSARGEVFVADAGSSTVSVISDTNNTIVSTITVGSPPSALAYDKGRGEVFVTDSPNYLALGNVSVISDSTNTVVATIPAGINPQGVAYDSGRGEVFVTHENIGSSRGNVSVISDANNTVVASIPVGSIPSGLAYDSGKGEIFVINLGSNTIDMISDANNTVTASLQLPLGTDPEGLAYISGKGEIYVTDLNSYNLSVISDGTDSVVATIDVGSGPLGVAYDAGNGYIYLGNFYGGTISVISPQGGYGVTFTETGLPPGTFWSLALNGVVETSSTSVITFIDPNGTYPYTVGSVTGYSAVPGSGMVTVSGASANLSISFTPVPTYSVTLQEKGLPDGTNWSANLAGTLSSSTTATINFRESNGTYALAVTPVSGYSASYIGSVVVSGGPVTVGVGFSNGIYPVTFLETGLPTGTSWTVTAVDGFTQISTTGQSTASSIALRLSNGTYGLSAGGPAGYRVSLSASSLEVSGSHPMAVPVAFNGTSPANVALTAVPWLTIWILVLTLLVAVVGAAWGYSRYRYRKWRSEAQIWVHEFNRDSDELADQPPK